MSRKNAERKLLESITDLELVARLGVRISEFKSLVNAYNYFLLILVIG
jgi:hypothetical protein